MAEVEVEGNANGFGQNEEEDCASNSNSNKPVIRKFYFVKHWPYQDPLENSKIEQAYKLIDKLEQDIFPLNERYRQKWSLIDNGHLQVSRLIKRERSVNHAFCLAQEKLYYLNAALDKLNFATISTSPGSQRIRMHHGISCKNLAKEKEFLKEIMSSTSQSQEADNDDDINIEHDWRCFKDRIHYFIGWLDREKRGEAKTRYKNFLKEMKQLEERIEKNKANASLKGRIWHPWTSTKTIQDHIILIKKLAKEIKQEKAEMEAEMERIERDDVVLKEEAGILIHQLNDLKRKRDDAWKCIFNLRKRDREANASYDEHLLLLSEAKKLARKKDIVALEELSRMEVDKFMSRWNSSKVLRNSYVKRIMPSLSNRQLSLDGRMRSHDDEEQPLN